MSKEESAFGPSCYKRHAAMDNHIGEGKFWRGVVIAFVMTYGAVLIGQYNMSIQNNEKMIALTSQLKTIAEGNIKRLDRLEERMFFYKSESNEQGAVGITGPIGPVGPKEK